MQKRAVVAGLESLGTVSAVAAIASAAAGTVAGGGPVFPGFGPRLANAGSFAAQSRQNASHASTQGVETNDYQECFDSYQCYN